MAEREIKTVLTLDDASFSKGLKAATGSVSAARAEMDASVASATGLGKGLKKYTAQITGLNKTIKAEKQQMAVLNKEYKTQQSRLKDLSKALQDTIEKNGEGSQEAEKAANAYASQSAKVDDLRVKMAKLTTTMAQDSSRLQSVMTQPFVKMAQAATAAVAAAGAALVKLTTDSEEAKSSLKQAQAANEVTFGQWSVFLEQEADKAWKNLGLSKAAYLEEATDIGEFLQDAGAPVEKVAEISAEVLEAAGQLSEKYGVPLTKILEDIKSAADGSRTAMARYGIQLTSTDVNQQSMAYDTAKTRKELNTENSVLNNIKQILDQSKSSQDDYAEGQRTVASATGELTAAWDNFLAGTGNAQAVGDAAAKFIISWATNLKANAWRIAEAAPYALDVFKREFERYWNGTVYPKIQEFFKIKFDIDLPDFKKLIDDINDGLFQIYFNLPDIARQFLRFSGLDTSEFDTRIEKLNDTKEKLQQLIQESSDSVMEGEFLDWRGGRGNRSELMRDLSDAMEDGAEGISDSSEAVKASMNDVSASAATLAKSTLPDFQRMLKAFSDALGTAAGQIAAAGDYVYHALGGAAGGGQFNALRDIGGNEGNFHHLRGFAGGAWNIPFDNFIARLHAGEMVLTADQARRYRAQEAAGGNTYNDSAAIYIDKYNQYSGADADGLLQMMQAMQRRQRMGYGLA